MRQFFYTLAAIAIVGVGYYWLSGDREIIGPNPVSQLPTIKLSYSDFISVLLTTLTILLGFFGLGIAIIAFRTKNEIMKDARATAEDVAKAEAQEKLTGLPEQAEEAINKAVEEILPQVLEEKLTQFLTDPAYQGRLDTALERAFLRQALGQTADEEEI